MTSIKGWAIKMRRKMEKTIEGIRKAVREKRGESRKGPEMKRAKSGQ